MSNLIVKPALPDNFISQAEIYRDYNVSKSTIVRYIKKGVLPKPIAYHPKYVGWLKPEVQSFLDLLELRGA